VSTSPGGDPRRSIDDLLGGATRDLRIDVESIDIEPFRPTRRRSPLVAGLAMIAVTIGAVVWVGRPTDESIVSGPAPTLASDPSLTTDPGGATAVPEESTPTSVRDLDARMPAELVRPSLDETVIDPAFGQQVTRITDSAPGEYIAPLTTLTSAFNADETKLLVYRTTEDGGGEHRVLDLTTGESVVAEIAPTDIEEVAWSSSEPDILIYVDGVSVMRFDVSTGSAVAVRTFDECEQLATAVGGAGLSLDGDVLSLACLSSSGDSLLAYRFSTDTVVTALREQNPDLFTQAPRVAASGDRFVFPTEARLGTVLDAALQPMGIEIDPLSTTALDVNGVDIAIGPSFGGDFAGSLLAIDLVTGEARPIVEPGPDSTSITNGMTVSASGQLVAFSTRAPEDLEAADWVAFDGEVVLVDLRSADPVVTRLAHNRTSSALGYWSSTFVSVSPSGERVAFSSDWGSGTSVDTYVIDVGQLD